MEQQACLLLLLLLLLPISARSVPAPHVPGREEQMGTGECVGALPEEGMLREPSWCKQPWGCGGGGCEV